MSAIIELIQANVGRTITVTHKSEGTVEVYEIVGTAGTKGKMKNGGEEPYMKTELSTDEAIRVFNVHPQRLKKLFAEGTVDNIVLGPVVEVNKDMVVEASNIKTVEDVVKADKKDDETPKADKAEKGETKTKKALEIFMHEQANAKVGVNPRGATMDRFVKELNMTKAGASTYYYLCKGGKIKA